MFRTTQKALASNCGSTAARCLLSPCSPTTAPTQMRSYFNGRAEVSAARPRYLSSDDITNSTTTHNITSSFGSPTATTNANNIHNSFDSSTMDERQSYFTNSSSRAPTPIAIVSASELNSASNGLSPSDYREAAEKVWGTLYATPERLENSVTGSAGSSRITHNLNHNNARWQASCVEVRQKEKKGDENENPVIAKRKKQFGSLMPWEKAEAEKKSKFPKSDKFPADDDVEIVFYFETHDAEGVGLKGYQNIAARVSDGDLPGECSNLTAVGGFATWTVPRSEFVALTESKPLLGEMLVQAPQRKNNAAETSRKADPNIGEALRRITIRMSNAEDQKKHFADATVV